MATDGTRASRLFGQQAALVPLRVAARVAYFQLSHTLRHAAGETDLEQIAPLVAVALSTVAPIRRCDGTVLSAREVRELFYRPRGKPCPDAALDGLAIRRADLKAAVASLRQARGR